MKTRKKAAQEIEMDFDSLKAEESEILQNKKKLNRLMDQEEDEFSWEPDN